MIQYLNVGNESDLTAARQTPSAYHNVRSLVNCGAISSRQKRLSGFCECRRAQRVATGLLGASSPESDMPNSSTAEKSAVQAEQTRAK